MIMKQSLNNMSTSKSVRKNLSNGFHVLAGLFGIVGNTSGSNDHVNNS